MIHAQVFLAHGGHGAGSDGSGFWFLIVLGLAAAFIAFSDRRNKRAASEQKRSLPKTVAPDEESPSR